jgi:phosphoenolpyruvate carboxykinase (GTP)
VWIFRRCAGAAEAVETPIGNVPAPGALNVEGLDISDEQVQELLAVDTDALNDEIAQVDEYLSQFGSHLPAEMTAQLEALKSRLA